LRPNSGQKNPASLLQAASGLTPVDAGKEVFVVSIITEKSLFDTGRENIPAELRALPQWVCWRYEDRNGRRTKAPIDATSNGRLSYAKSNDSETWADFDTALTACGLHPELAGVGFCFAPDDGLTGIDLDHVFNPDTGELSAEAAEILAKFKGTYAEISPSGTGLRLFCYGKPRRSGKNTGKVKWLEVYSHPSSRYLTVTGNHWSGNAASVTDQQAALDWLHTQFMASTGADSKPSVDSKPGPVDPPNLNDAELLAKARAAKNGAEFDRLWSGDTSGHGGDHSAADLALCDLLAFWTDRDSDRIDRLFRQSGLMRPKWDTRRGESTYGALTVAKAVASTPETYSARKPSAEPQPAEAANVEPAALQKDENHFSDYGNVIKLMERLSGGIAYTSGLVWLLYNPDTGIWEPEPGSERVKRMALEALREAWGEILQGAQSKESDLKKQLKELDSEDPTAAMIGKRLKLATSYRERVFGWMMQCETAYRIRSTLEIAEGYFWTAPDVWDSNAHILVCANGVLDLATGALLPHSPDFRATKTTGTDYRPGANHPAWNAAVALLKSEGDRYEFVHQFCGSGLHGANPNERVVIFQGDGGTGKGTLLTAIHHALGDYVATVEVGSLLATDWRKQNKSAPREDLLKLRGARFVYPSIEPPKDSKLDDGSIKALTGNDAITARYPHGKNSITFQPVFKLAIQTNFPLQTEFDDPGMKRRVIVVPFNQKPVKPDPTVKHDLMHDPNARAAVLAWLYEGYRAWLGSGFALPVSALATRATADYWADMNPYEQFAADAGLKFGKLERCQKPKITSAFKVWRDETGRLDASLKGFPGWLRGKGCFDQQVTGGGRLWYGVGFPDQKSLESPKSPPVSQNNTVEIQYSNSTDHFPESGSYSGYSGYGDKKCPSVETDEDGQQWEKI
jgi:putative DNA primase/helicase